MANKNILTNGSRISQVEQVFFSPVAVVPPNTTSPIASIYCFLSKVDPWGDENDPPTPTEDTATIKSIYKNMFVAKKINSNDLSPVIQRVDWTTGTTYDYYRDDVNMAQKDNNGNNFYNYYVKNHYDQVFKCLWNNNDSPSTVEPFFEPGSYDTNNIYNGTDGYKWKYIYTIDTGSKVKFMDTNWIPVTVGANTPNPLSTSAGSGSIDVINVTDGGSGYDVSNAIITVTITGDGSGASATANVTGNTITDIIVTSPGSNYTFANVTITSAIGSGAEVIAPTSPIGGHGFDPVSDLGCSHIMFTCQFNGSENGTIPTDIDFHQVGLLINPTSSQTYPEPANGSIYSTTTDFIVAPGPGVYLPDEVIYQAPQGQGLAGATFTGKVLSFDTSTNVIKVLNKVGTPSNNSPVFGQTSGVSRVILSYNLPNFTLMSGYMSLIENRTGVQRSADGIEQFKFVLGY